MSKYHNKKTVVDGVTFDSKAEAARYCELKLLLKGGIISDLELQPSYTLLDKYTLNGKAIRAIVYRADFRYREGSMVIVEDVKGALTAVYKLKKKMLLSRYPDINFREV